MFRQVTLIVFSLSCAGAQYGPPGGGPPQMFGPQGGMQGGPPPPPGGFAKMYNACHQKEIAALAAMNTSGGMQMMMTPDIMKSKNQNHACYDIHQGVKALLGLAQFGPPPPQMMGMMMMGQGQAMNDTAMRRNDSIACPTTTSTIQQILQQSQGGSSGTFASTCCDLSCYCTDVSQSTSTTSTTPCGGYFQPFQMPGNFQASFGQMPNGGFQASFGGPPPPGGQQPYYQQQVSTGTGTNQQPQMPYYPQANTGTNQQPQMPYYPQANTGNVPSNPQMSTGQYTYQG